MFFLVRKELRVKYRNTLLGYFWSLLEPLGLMIIYSIVFSLIMRFEVDNYPLLLLSGLIPWMFVSHSINTGSKILTLNASLIKKVYFPRQLFPITVVTTNIINLMISLVLVGVFSIIYGGGLGLSLVWLPFVMFFQYLLVLSVVLILSSISVYYRDIEFMSSLGIRGWMYLSPIIYPISIIPDEYINLYMLNPMATIISIYHHIFYGAELVEFKWILYTIGVTIFLLFICWTIFGKLSKKMGEVI
ncbi:ABC transporter permease [Alkalihalobacillus alcalophilus]|uniref:ABC transporter permease n=1 Tax=Alkalihalobacillus alcalophilus TaxID=1445 RepID=UPI002E2436AC|nr:ABC transporter permease [Alkalihalobacillus alcalophilus]MED1561675.1 ABC transporter permease [Alkalihalobacillus alcalophilus]